MSPLRILLWKPAVDTTILYSPTGRDGALKSPWSLVDTFRTRPVSVWVMVTEQFGRTPPVASETVPRMFPVATCAQQTATLRAVMVTILNSCFISLTSHVESVFGLYNNAWQIVFSAMRGGARHEVVDWSEFQPRGS